MILRPYQAELFDQARRAFRAGHRRICVVLPTGGGKSAIIGHAVQQATARGLRVYVVAHRRRLVQQLTATVTAWGAPDTLVRSVQSIRCAALPPPDLLIVDEAHHLVAGNQWGRLIDAWPDAFLLGLTATPARLDGVGLGHGHGGYFQQLVIGPDARWLTDHGFLAPARVFSWPGPSLTGIRTRMGDLDLQQAEQAMAGLMGDAVTEYQRHLAGQTAIANCCSVAHAEAVAAAFRADGIPAAALTGTVSRQEQDRLFADLACGTLKVLCQCEIVSEGVDLPSVAGALMLRPTQSTVVWLQQLGRALRPAPGKAAAIILDHAGNARRPGLGLPTDPRDWTMEGRKRRKGDPVPPVRSCPACYCCVPASVSECPECGHIWQVQIRELKRLEGSLSEIAQEAIRWHRVKEERSCLSLEEWEALGRARGYAPGWARIRYAARLRRVKV